MEAKENIYTNSTYSYHYIYKVIKKICVRVILGVLCRYPNKLLREGLSNFPFFHFERKGDSSG